MLTFVKMPSQQKFATSRWKTFSLGREQIFPGQAAKTPKNRPLLRLVINVYNSQYTSYPLTCRGRCQGTSQGPQRDLFHQQVPSRNPLYIGILEDLGTCLPFFNNARLFLNTPRLSKSTAVRRISSFTNQMLFHSLDNASVLLGLPVIVYTD